MSVRLSLIGQRFGRLFVISDAPTKKGKSYSHVKCDCGKFIIANNWRLKKAQLVSCGCKIKRHKQPYQLWLEKTCKGCGQAKPFTDFNNGKRNLGGLHPYCKSCQAKRGKTYYFQNQVVRKAVNKKWREANRSKVIANGKRYKGWLKALIISHYTNGENKCACCGETHEEFLTVDHIFGGGKRHRQEVGDIYGWLKRNNFPTGYRILCFNCNCAFGFFGYCPHQKSQLYHDNRKAAASGI